MNAYIYIAPHTRHRQDLAPARMNLFSAIYHRFKKARWQIEYEVVSGEMIVPKRVPYIQHTHWLGKSDYITIRNGPQVSFERDVKTSTRKGSKAIGGGCNESD